MAELIFTDAPRERAAETVLREYKGGTVALYGDSPDTQRVLCKAGISYVTCDGEPPEYARFFIGTGDFASLNAAKYFAGGYPLLLLPDAAERICFNNLCAKGLHILATKEPEYVIFDKRRLKTSRPTLTASLFGALTDAVDLLSGRGYGSGELSRARERLMDVLYCPVGDTVAISELKGAEQSMTEFTGAAAHVPFVNLALEDRSDSAFDFFSYYLINLSLLQFTKRDFNGILLGADRVRVRNALKPCAVREVSPQSPCFWRERAQKAVLTRELLAAAAYRFREESLGEYRGPGAQKTFDNLLIAWEYAGTDGLFSALAGEGFIEGLTEDEIKN